jgi:hypothetical protein
MHGARGAVHGMNAAASQMLGEADGIRLRGGAIEATGAAEARALTVHLAEAIDGSPYLNAPTYSALSVARPSGRMPYLVLVVPLSQGAGTEGRPERVALVLIRDLERHSQRSAT